jgi:hypothetical protein
MHTDSLTYLLSSVGAAKVWLQQGHWIMPVVSCSGHWALLLLTSLLGGAFLAFFAFLPFLAVVRCTRV